MIDKVDKSSYIDKEESRINLVDISNTWREVEFDVTISYTEEMLRYVFPQNEDRHLRTLVRVICDKTNFRKAFVAEKKGAGIWSAHVRLGWEDIFQKAKIDSFVCRGKGRTPPVDDGFAERIGDRLLSGGEVKYNWTLIVDKKESSVGTLLKGTWKSFKKEPLFRNKPGHQKLDYYLDFSRGKDNVILLLNKDNSDFKNMIKPMGRSSGQKIRVLRNHFYDDIEHDVKNQLMIVACNHAIQIEAWEESSSGVEIFDEIIDIFWDKIRPDSSDRETFLKEFQDESSNDVMVSDIDAFFSYTVSGKKSRSVNTKKLIQEVIS
jgi:hypothetical protein